MVGKKGCFFAKVSTNKGLTAPQTAKARIYFVFWAKQAQMTRALHL
jgi:hypothetical protein